MLVSRLTLRQFRNYREATVTAPPGLIVVSGPNGAGKTNLLEAVYFLAVLKSFRTGRDADLIRQGEENCRLDAEVQGKRGTSQLTVTLGPKGKRAAVNDEPFPRLLDYVGNLAAVAFSPEDADIVRGEPASRRRFLDVWLAQQRREYLYDLGRYAEILRRRNYLLQTGAASSLREPYDEELIATGSSLIMARREAVIKLAAEARAAFAAVAPPGEGLDLTYLPSIPPGPDDAATREQFRSALAAVRENEARRRTSLVGPHRDDLWIAINGDEARRFASEGQIRTCALALKYAQFRLLKRSLGEAPVLLLDDVGAELDEARRDRLAAIAREAQQAWFATPSAPPAVDADAFIRVDRGRLS